MKNFTLPELRKMTVAAGLLLAIGSSAHAATYTAVASGNFTSAATWGGTAPSTTISGDDIVIPGGITVTLDQDVSLSGSATLNVLGELVSAGTEDLAVTSGAVLSGGGNVMVDSITLGGSSASLLFAGNLDARAFTSLGLAISSLATITVGETVNIASGILNLVNATVTIANGSTIVMSGGTLNIGMSATLNLNAYDVMYTSQSANAGLELTGPGLEKVVIAVPATASVTLNGDLVMNDTLTLGSGTLVLNGNDLGFQGNGNVSASGTGTISTSNSSGIYIASDNSFDGSLRFASGANTVDELYIDMNNSSAVVKLGSDLAVDGMLSLQAGKLDIGANELTISAGGTVDGGSTDSYVITGADGSLTMNIAAGVTDTFLVGTTASFAPIVVSVNTGSTGGNISAGVKTGLQSGASVGTDLAATQPVVNATWMVSTDATGNVDMNLSPAWTPAMEVNGFNRTEAFVSLNTNGTWDVMASSAATTAGMLWMMTRANVTSSGTAVAVMDKDAVNSVKEVAAGTGNGIDIYPNPVATTLHFNLATSLRAPIAVNIYDVAGHLVKSVTASSNNTVSVAELPAGFYTAQFSSGNYKAIEKFVKH